MSAGAFVKNIEDFWGTRAGTVDAALASELGIGTEFIGWGVSTTINAGDAKIEGVELNFIRPLTFIRAGASISRSRPTAPSCALRRQDRRLPRLHRGDG